MLGSLIYEGDFYVLGIVFFYVEPVLLNCML